jgi:hypothetical protein
VKVLLLFLLLTFLVATRAANRNRPSRMSLLAIAALFTAGLFLSQRVI